MTPPEHFAKINRLKVIMGFKIPLDGLMMMILEKPVIDILALDKRLKKDFNYKGSMSDFIKTKFGQEALGIINNNL